MKMPLRILIIGASFCLAGLTAVADVFQSLSEHHLNINFGIFLLPIGIGLLRGSPSSQWWARLWIVLGYAICAIVLVFSLLWPGSVGVHLPSRSVGEPINEAWNGVAIALLLLLLFLTHRLLYSRKAERWFRSE
jgi:hypothetical protein